MCISQLSDVLLSKAMQWSNHNNNLFEEHDSAAGPFLDVLISLDFCHSRHLSPKHHWLMVYCKDLQNQQAWLFKMILTDRIVWWASHKNDGRSHQKKVLQQEQGEVLGVS
jgi:hypothetical protein